MPELIRWAERLFLIPERPGVVPVGAFRWFLDNVEGCCRQLAVV